MSIPRLTNLTLVFILMLFTAKCSIVKNDNGEKEVRNFLSRFEKDIFASDENVIKYFRVTQSKKAILSVIEVLRNNDPIIKCMPEFSNAKILFRSEHIYIDIPVTFKLDAKNENDELNFILNLTLFSIGESFIISGINGEDFYQAYLTIKNRNEWLAERKLALQERLEMYEYANILEKVYDSVIWAVRDQGNLYYYVTSGPWVNTFLNNYNQDTSKVQPGTKMGLISKSGKTIIPIVFDLIGTLSFVDKHMVEVKSNNKIGYFNLNSNALVIDTIYDFVIPYLKNNIWAIVKKDTMYGWYDFEFNYHPGFATEDNAKWLSDFIYLKKNIQLNSKNYILCEIPNENFLCNGIIIPPNYLVRNKIFNEIEGDISNSNSFWGGSIEYKETTGSFVEQVTNNLRLLITSIKSRYIEGREEFYSYNQISFIGNTKTSFFDDFNGSNLKLNLIDSSMLEVSRTVDYWNYDSDVVQENNLSEYTYFSVTNEEEIVMMKSDRMFPQTEFVKLDSTYLKGEFEIYNEGLKDYVKTYYLSKNTLLFMRDEILALRGYNFSDDPERRKFFESFLKEKYQPIFSSQEEMQSQLSDIDRHNIQFISKQITNHPNNKAI